MHSRARLHVGQVIDTLHAFDVFLIVRFPCEFSDIAFLPYAAPKVFWEIPSGPVEERVLHLFEINANPNGTDGGGNSRFQL